MKAAEVRAFMADVDRAALPTAAEAKALQRDQEDMRAREPTPPQADHPPAETPTTAPEARQQDLGSAFYDPSALDPVVARALDERQRQEAAKLAEWHAAELRQLENAQAAELQAKQEHQAALHAAARERLQREQKLTGIEGFFNALQNRLNPGRGAEQRAAREHAWRQLRAQQARERRDMEVLWRQTHAEQMEELRERHMQQQREQAAAFEAERQRYTEDAERAAEMRRRIEEDRKIEERQRQERRDTGPPGLTK